MATSLCYTGRIRQLLPINGADRIQLAVVDCGMGGCWRGVVTIHDFPSVEEAGASETEEPRGVLATVFLMDAIVPKLPGLEFMEKQHGRVRMCRYKGVPSECLIVRALTDDTEIGVDLTERMQVTKYEKELSVHLRGLARGTFPSMIPRTDETHGQKVSPASFVPGTYAVTLKCDGTSSTAYRWGDHFGVCSRNIELKDGDNVYWKIAKQYRLEETLPAGIAIQWETCGPKIGNNMHKLRGCEGYVFAAYDITRHAYLSVAETEALAARVGMPMVPRFADVALTHIDVDALQEEAKTLAVHAETGTMLEGLVYRLLDEGGEKRSFKILNLDYKH